MYVCTHRSCRHVLCLVLCRYVHSVHVETHSVFFCVGMYTPFMYLLLKTESLGISNQQGALLFSIINIVATIARVVTGWVAGMPCASSVVLSSSGMIAAGVVTVLCVFSSTYTQLVIYAVVFGTSIGRD